MKRKQSSAPGLLSFLLLAAAIGCGMLLSLFTRNTAPVMPTSTVSIQPESSADVPATRPSRPSGSSTPSASVSPSSQSGGSGNSTRPASRPASSSASSERPRGNRTPGEWDAEKNSTRASLDREAPVGGYVGGNLEAVREGRLEQNTNSDINTNPEAFQYYLNAKVILEKPLGSGNICAENTPGNLCPMQVQYFLTGTKDPIYTSAMIWPGECVTEDYLSVRLSKGEYDVTAVINVFDPDSLEVKETFQEAVHLTVNNKLFGIF